MDKLFRESTNNKQVLKESMGYLFKNYSQVSKALFFDEDQITMDEICQKVQLLDLAPFLKTKVELSSINESSSFESQEFEDSGSCRH